MCRSKGIIFPFQADSAARSRFEKWMSSSVYVSRYCQKTYRSITFVGWQHTTIQHQPTPPFLPRPKQRKSRYCARHTSYFFLCFHSILVLYPSLSDELPILTLFSPPPLRPLPSPPPYRSLFFWTSIPTPGVPLSP